MDNKGEAKEGDAGEDDGKGEVVTSHADEEGGADHTMEEGMDGGEEGLGSIKRMRSREGSNPNNLWGGKRWRRW